MFHVEDGRTVAVGAFLPDITECRQIRDLPDDLELFLFLLFLEPAFQFGMIIKVILDRALVPPRHQLFHDVLHYRFIDYREHFFRQCFGDRQKPSAKACHCHYGFRDFHSVGNSGLFNYLTPAAKKYLRQLYHTDGKISTFLTIIPRSWCETAAPRQCGRRRSCPYARDRQWSGRVSKSGDTRAPRDSGGQQRSAAARGRRRRGGKTRAVPPPSSRRLACQNASIAARERRGPARGPRQMFPRGVPLQFFQTTNAAHPHANQCGREVDRRLSFDSAAAASACRRRTSPDPQKIRTDRDSAPPPK